MPKEYVYSDVDRTLAIEPDGNIKIHYDENAVIQSVRNILSTISGERVRTALGSSLVTLLFEPITVETATSIRLLLMRDLQRYEPRIEVLNVDVIPDPDGGVFNVYFGLRIRKIQKRIDYRIPLRSLAV